MTERRKPTPEEVLKHAFSSPGVRKQVESQLSPLPDVQIPSDILFLSKEDLTTPGASLRKREKVQIQLLVGDETLTLSSEALIPESEIQIFLLFPFGITLGTYLTLKRNGITKIEQLPPVLLDQPPRRIYRKSERQIETAVNALTRKLIKKIKEDPDITPIIGPPIQAKNEHIRSFISTWNQINSDKKGAFQATKRYFGISEHRLSAARKGLPEVDREKAWLQKNAEIIDFIARWQEQNPGILGALKAAAEKFGVSRETVRQIKIKLQKITRIPDALELQLPTEEAVRFIKNWQEENPGERGGLSATARNLNTSFYIVKRCIEIHERLTHESLKPQELTPEERRKAKEKVLMSKSIEETMNFLTNRRVGQMYPGVFVPLAKIAREAEITHLKEISRIFNALEMAKSETRFILKRFEHEIKGKTVYYYFAHFRQKEEILTWLSESYTP